MNAFSKALKACVASWVLLKREAMDKGVSAYNLVKEREWKPDLEELRRVAGHVEPFDFQRSVYEVLKERAGEGGIVVVEAPTAAGKTEAAVAAFLSQGLEGEWWLAPRLVYTLPTKALTLTTYARLEAYSRGMATLYSTPHLPVSFEYGSPIGYKRYLYGGVLVATTLDAAIYGYAALRVPGGFRNPRLSMPVALLSTSLLVLDEVQLYQDAHYYSPRVIGMIARNLARAGIPVVYMTATLPSTLLELLAGAECELVPAPPVGKRRVMVDLEYLKRRVKLPELLAERSLLESMRNTLDEGRHVLVVANTVKRALECYELLQELVGRDHVLLIHGRMANQPREEREGELFSQSFVVVATQVVEAGFDLEAGLLITELAPLDSLIQRTGRVARKGGGGLALIADVEEHLPYVEEFVDETRRILINDPSALERSVVSVREARALLDDLYTRSLVEKLMERAAAPIVRTRMYLSKLRLFSLPPREDFSLREGFYFTLVVPEIMLRLASSDVKAAVEAIVKASESVSRGGDSSSVVAIEREKWGEVSNLFERAALSLGFQWRRAVSPHIASSLSVSVRRENETRRYFIKLVREGIRPLGVYMLKQGVYDLDTGLALKQVG